MQTRRSSVLIFIVCLSLLAFWGCPKKTEVTSAPEGQQEKTAEQKRQEEAALERARQEKERQERERQEREAQAAKERASAAATGLQPVYFDFDRAFIRQDAQAVMKANADWIKAHPDVKIKIEGNCDERGTIEYNQALGQRRAASAKKFLTDLGISAGRISLISYGKEKPACSESTEDCWQKNRRDEFVAQ